jgi:hypothetical protein
VGYTLPAITGTKPMEVTRRFYVAGVAIGAVNDLTGIAAEGTEGDPMLLRLTCTNVAGTVVFDSPALIIAAVEENPGVGTWTLGPWRAPERDVENELIENLAGYAIYLSQQEFIGAGAATRIVIGDPETLSYEATDLISGRWYGWVATINTSGNEGPEQSLGFKDIA